MVVSTGGGFSIDISVLGDKKLAKRLNAFSKKLQTKIVKKAAREVGKDILAEAKTRTPVGPKKEAGKHLKNTLKLRNLKKKKGQIGVLIATGTREELGIPTTDKYYYPAGIELGNVKVRAGGRSFLRVSLENNRGPGIEKFKKAIQAGIRNASKAS